MPPRTSKPAPEPEALVTVPEFEFKPKMRVRVSAEYAADCPGDEGAAKVVGYMGRVVERPYHHAHPDDPGYVYVRLMSAEGAGPVGVWHFLPGELDLMEEG